MIEISIDSPFAKAIREPKKQESTLSRLSEEVLNRDIDHLWKKMVTRHPVDSTTKTYLEGVASKISSEVSYKDTDVYWSRICAEISDPFYRMVVLASLQKSEMGLTPKQILQDYLNNVIYKQAAQHSGIKTKESHGNATLIMNEFIGPADIAALAKDPVRDVCDPVAYAKRMPNCIQVSTVFSRVFSLIGEPATPIRYSGDLIPHVGVVLLKDNKLLKYEVKDTENGMRTLVQERSMPAVAKWQNGHKK